MKIKARYDIFLDNKSMRKCFHSTLSLNMYVLLFFVYGKKVNSISHRFFLPTPNYCSPVPLILKKMNPLIVTIVSAWVMIFSSKSQSSYFFWSPQALKNLTSPIMQTKSPDNSNMLHMFNNNTYTDSRTAWTDVLFPSYVFGVI